MKLNKIIGSLSIAAIDITPVISLTSCDHNKWESIDRTEWFNLYQQYYNTYVTSLTTFKYTKDDLSVKANGASMIINSVDYDSNKKFWVNDDYFAGDTVDEMKDTFEDNENTHYYKKDGLIKIESTDDDGYYEEQVINSYGYKTFVYWKDTSGAFGKYEVTYNKDPVQ